MQYVRKYKSALLLGAGVTIAVGALAAIIITDILAPINGPKSVISETYPDRNCAVRWYSAEIDKRAVDDLRLGYMEVKGNGERELKFYDFISGVAVISDSPVAKRIGTPYVIDMEESPMQIRLPNIQGEYDVEIFIQGINGKTEISRRSVELDDFYPTC